MERGIANNIAMVATTSEPTIIGPMENTLLSALDSSPTSRNPSENHSVPVMKLMPNSRKVPALRKMRNEAINPRSRSDVSAPAVTMPRKILSARL
jgi:hypothetical protein